jgi:hypothetical protein
MKNQAINIKDELKAEYAILTKERRELVVRLGKLQAITTYDTDGERYRVCQAWSRCYNRMKEIENSKKLIKKSKGILH